MLVSKIKPCMSKYKLFFIWWNCEWLIKSVIVYFFFITWITVVILELIHAEKVDREERKKKKGIYFLFFFFLSTPLKTCIYLIQQKKPINIFYIIGDSK